MSIWTPELVHRLKVFWADGLTYGQIADEMGLSRNAVLSKGKRIGLDARIRRPARPKPRPQRKTPFVPRPSDRQVTRPRIGADSRMTLAFDVPRDAMTDLPADESADAVRWLDRNGDTCRWPLNDVVPIDAHMVCGTACDSEHAYCARHFRLSVNPSRPRVLQLSEVERALRVAQGKANQRAHKQRLAAS